MLEYLQALTKIDIYDVCGEFIRNVNLAKNYIKRNTNIKCSLAAIIQFSQNQIKANVFTYPDLL